MYVEILLTCQWRSFVVLIKVRKKKLRKLHTDDEVLDDENYEKDSIPYRNAITYGYSIGSR